MYICTDKYDHFSSQVSCLITQNVDQLHYKAGSRHVIELHGTNSRVTCMSCCFSQPRLQFQRVLETHNPDMRAWVRRDKPPENC